jgi:hypothetical protein
MTDVYCGSTDGVWLQLVRKELATDLLISPMSESPDRYVRPDYLHTVIPPPPLPETRFNDSVTSTMNTITSTLCLTSVRSQP